MNLRLLPLFGLLLLAVSLRAAAPDVTPVHAPHGMVVAIHPEAVALGVEVLRAGGNAMDAAVTVSLAVGVAEPYGSGLGGKLVMLYHDAASGTTTAVDALDAAGSRLDVQRHRALGREASSVGWTSVCVPGLPAGLFEAHRRWGARPWEENVRPVVRLAREGFTLLPGVRQAFVEREDVLNRGDPEVARLYRPGLAAEAEGRKLPNADLGRTLELLAEHGRDGFYRGPVAEALVAAVRQGGGWITAEDLARYEVRFSAPLKLEFAGRTLLAPPPPGHGAPIILATLAAAAKEAPAGAWRDAANLDRFGRLYLAQSARVRQVIGDAAGTRAAAEALIASPALASRGDAARDGDATTHLIVVDRHGNIACISQSLSLHFGAGVIAPGTGFVLNNTMSNFNYTDPNLPNHAAPGRRPWSTTSPIVVLEGGRPVLTLGLPGGTRIPSGIAQVLADHLQFGRPLATAIADTRVHWVETDEPGPGRLEAENTLPVATAEALRRMGWNVDTRRVPGASSHFGGVNAVVLEPDGSRTGLADPRRLNVAAGH
jgi:gamma-glutamyltranspeptidase / glutathione hydrolase